ncbi:putative nucleic acid-binding protein, contains PIN domain [Candidatus Methanoperedens nitroreducens]|uniref:Putative nucleic acid-binding protein, contains PIN domain n=1 Tax=Candidatus Methanoperedens nitratireducens TaxID=1392998 RepID=A0A062V2V2_9EURY|nr:PIN domain-containing protein [Candidatus Methanoperedens nitroreducens]KCZ70913.1 putative nucleic acid-binding protein, contains PIN domain [Candidatus Methanoperedens nitroreducens]MDJ1421719.1 PIN domain-containing protein [Candidatus Methanoperedens sp.]
MIFADSSYFIALARDKDRWHEDALKLTEEIKDSLMISDLVISESVTLVGSLEGGKAGKLLYEYLTDNCKIEFIDREMLARGMWIFLKYDGSISLADATSVEIMKQHRIKKIISFDNDFDKIKEIERLH